MAHTYDPQLDAFELYHKELERESTTSLLGGPALPALGHAISGAAGSAISNVVTYPLSLLVTRLQVQRQLRQLKSKDSPPTEEYKSVLDAAQKIYAEEGGISAFYSGCGQDSAKTVCDAFLFFLAYNFFKQGRLNKHGTKRLPVHEELGVGMLAGALSRAVTAPVQNIVTRKQTARMIAKQSGIDAKPPTTTEIAQQIQEEKGVLGFWSGYSATLVLTFNPALTFLLHESSLRLLVKREERSNPGSRKTFLIAALSKAIASTITYPFSLAKSRAQVSSKTPANGPTDPEKITSSDSKEQIAHKAVNTVKKQETIFSVILRIAREEGIESLYQGLEGEVLKGFFSHGLTMLLKERIHKVVIQTYYFLLKLSERYPSPEDLAKSASQTVPDRAAALSAKTQEAVKVATEKTKEAAQSVAEGSQQAVQSISEKSQEAYNGVSEKTQEIARSIGSHGQEAVDGAVSSVTDLYEHGKHDQMQVWDEYLLTDDDD